MCNEFEQQLSYDSYLEAMQDLAWPVSADQTASDLPPRASIRISDTGAAMVADGGAVRLAPMRFCWLLPNRAPMFNIRSDNPQLPRLARALVPASAFFEFSGEKTRKSKHRVTLNAAPFMAIAAAWKPAKGNEPASFALVTTEPGADILPYHPRQMAVLQPSEWQAWLAGGDLGLLRALPPGTLAVETIRTASGAAAPGKPGSLL